MPMFLDRHEGVDATPEEVAQAHTMDLAVENKYGVHYHTYWFDTDNRTIFCLAEGADKEAIDLVHKEAHGLSASTIIEIDPNVPLNQLFGSIVIAPAGTPTAESAVRGIVFTDLCGSVAQTQQLGDDGHLAMLREHDEIVRKSLGAHQGREVKHTGDGIMAAFTSVTAAVACSIDVQRALHNRNQIESIPLDVSIGISAGEPVTNDNDDLFGAAVQLAARLCGAADAGEIMVSVAVRELCMGKQIGFADQGKIALKGLPEPAQVFGVVWREV
jgi:class 3 adenylate cyclase